MNIDWVEAGAVMISGLVIVFLALIILIALVMLMGNLLGGVKKPAKGKDAPASAAQAAPSAPSAPAIQGGIEEETVAVISAAVACAMEQSAPGVPYAVTSIRRGREARPVWGFAGMQQNTRPF